MVIVAIGGFFLILLFIYLSKTPAVYLINDLDEIDPYLHFFLIYGKSDESLAQNALLTIMDPYSNKGLGIIKYNEKGNSGLCISIEKKDLNKKQQILLDLFERNKTIFFEWGLKNEYIGVLLGYNFAKIKRIITFIWKEIFNIELKFFLSFSNGIKKTPENNVKEYIEKNHLNENKINKFPITKLDWIISKVKKRR